MNTPTLLQITRFKNPGTLFLFLFLSLLSFNFYGQNELAVLRLRDGRKITGTGEVSGISTVVTAKFKNDTLPYRTYDSKEIIGIDIPENNYYRQYRYKYVDGSKFPELLELIFLGDVSLYCKIYGDTPLYESPLNLDVETPKGNTYKFAIVPGNFVYSEITVQRISYYIAKAESDQVEHLYTRGLPFSKSFKKAITQRFVDCGSLIEKIKNEDFLNNDVPAVIDYYNTNCSTVTEE